MPSSQTNAIWKEIKAILHSKLTQDAYNRWIFSIIPIDINEDLCRLGISSDIFAEWLEDNYTSIILEAIYDVTTFSNTKLSFEVLDPSTLAKESNNAPAETEVKTATVKIKKSKKYENPFRTITLNKHHSFDSFVVGESNKFAHASAIAVSDTPGKAYNPLFICGSTGLGKSHLLEAIAQRVIDTKKRARVEYITCEDFLNLYIDSLQHKTLPRFRRHYRSLDLLLIDDIQFLAGKKGIQEEFFHTFNSLFNAHKQIVLASDKMPDELEGLEKRLVSRFDSGLTTEIYKPDLETRMAILKAKQEAQNIKIPDNLLLYIASRISSHIRALEGALTTLLLHSSLSKEPITKELIDRCLSRKFEQESPTNLNVGIIQKRVADHFDIRVADIVSKKRPSNIAFPRQIAMYLSRKLTRLSTNDIGDLFAKNHATVIHAISSIEKKMAEDDHLKLTINRLHRELQTG